MKLGYMFFSSILINTLMLSMNMAPSLLFTIITYDQHKDLCEFIFI